VSGGAPGAADDGVSTAEGLVDLLWPPEEGSPGGGGRVLAVLPSRARPRLVVPAAPPRAAAAAVRALVADRSWRGRGRREALAAVAAAGGLPLLARRSGVRTGGGGVDAWLSDLVGREVVCGVLLGPPRANRKPVLAVLTPDGERVGYAKVGAGRVARPLVRAEASALEALAQRRPRVLLPPRLLHRGTFRGTEVVVQSPLATARARPARPHLLLEAAREVVAGAPGRAALRESPAWTRTRARLAAAGAPDLAAAAEELAARAGDVVVPLGAWHGDWTPWNTAELDGRVLAWDWERRDVGAPAGFDALHHDLAAGARARGRTHREAAEATTAAAARLLAPFGVEAAAAPAVACAYLLEVGSRYVADGQAVAGHRSGLVSQWLLPVLRRRLAEVAP